MTALLKVTKKKTFCNPYSNEGYIVQGLYSPLRNLIEITIEKTHFTKKKDNDINIKIFSSVSATLVAVQNRWFDGQKYEESIAKQSLMKCPDLSNTIIFERWKLVDGDWSSYYNSSSYWKYEVVLEVNPTCAEYFEMADPCNGIACNENASCITKGNSSECSCNEGFINTNDATDSSGWFF